MPNPSREWDLVPVYGIWQARPGVPATGQIRLTIPGRVQRVDGRVIYPGPIVSTITLGDVSQQDVTVRNAVRQAYRDADQAAAAAAGETFDGPAWDARWDAELPGAIFTAFYASDDPDILGSYQIRVEEMLAGGGTGLTYYIEPLLAHLDLPVPGVNLGLVVPPPGSPAAPAAVYAKGVPGGVAALDYEGDVVDAAGNKVTGGGGGGAPAEHEHDYVAPDDPRLSDAREPTAHQHPASDVSDSTSVGRAVLTAADAAAARAAIGAGTSNLALGTTGTTAAAGNDARLSDQRTPVDGSVTAAKIADNAVVNRTIIDGAVTDAKVAAANKDGAAGTPSMRTLGTGANQAAAGNDPRLSDARTPTTHTHTAAQVSDATTVGRAVLTAADAAAARAAIGAGTSSLALGTTSSTAAAGDAVARLTGAQTIAGVKTFSSAPVVPDGAWTVAKTSGLQAALDTKASAIHSHTAADITDEQGPLPTHLMPRGVPLYVLQADDQYGAAGSWPSSTPGRSDQVRVWVGWDDPGSLSVDGLDLWVQVPAP